MSRVALVVVGLLVLSPIAHGEELPATGSAALVLANAADLGTTIWVLQTGAGHEANPLLSPGLKAIVPTKIAATVLTVYAMHVLARKGHPTFGRVIAYVSSAALAGIAAHNAQIAGRR